MSFLQILTLTKPTVIPSHRHSWQVVFYLSLVDVQEIILSSTFNLIAEECLVLLQEPFGKVTLSVFFLNVNEPEKKMNVSLLTILLLDMKVPPRSQIQYPFFIFDNN